MRTFQTAAVFAAAVSALAAGAGAQERRGSEFGGSPKDVVLATASDWGGQGGVYTCDQWKAYLTRLFNQADTKRQGSIDAREFETIKRASPLFERAEFGFFGADTKGRLSRQAFVNQRGMFFARYDKKGSCRVTSAELAAATASERKSPPTGFRNRGDDSGNFGGMSIGGFGGRF